MKMIALGLLAAATMLSTPALAGAPARLTKFNFSNVLSTSSGVEGFLTGSFRGIRSGNTITDITDVSAALNGVAFAGPLGVWSRNSETISWNNSGAYASIDGTSNNFLFINGNPSSTSPVNYTNYYGSLFGVYLPQYNYTYRTEIASPDGRTGYYRDYAASASRSAMTITAVEEATAAVPEPATWGMMILGFGVVGASMRRRKSDVRTSVRFA